MDASWTQELSRWGDEPTSRFATPGLVGGSAGVLNHRINRDQKDPLAVFEPPATGRARLRGQAIRRLAVERGAWRCGGQYIIHNADGRMLDLSNLFTPEGRWLGKGGGGRSPGLRNPAYLESLRRRA